MLLDMLTADAAAKHALDFSSPQPSPSPASHGASLLQMPLALLGSVLRGQTAPPPPPAGAEGPSGVEAAAQRPEPTVRNAAHDSPMISPAPSRPASSGSSAITDEKPRRRSSRPKTTYCLAQPARTANARSKLHLRPKVILQLHQLIPSQRPKPVYDVIPFSLLPPRSNRQLARTFNTRERLCPTDLLIVKAQEYGSKDDESRSEDERWGARDAIGVIRPANCDKGKTEICMDDGASRWEVTLMANGSYEFNTVDDHGLALKARWVLKTSHGRQFSGMSSGSQLSPTFPPSADDKKFTFSTISANSRRHPVIATMTRSRIEVLDSYVMPSATTPPSPGLPSTLPSPALTPSSIHTTSFLSNGPESIAVETDDALRKFIVATGVWIAHQNLTTPDHSNQSPVSSPITSTFRPPNHRTVSMSSVDRPRSASPASTLGESRYSIPRFLRSGAGLGSRKSSSTEASSPLSANFTPSSSPVQKTRVRRAQSAGHATLSSTSESMRRRYGLSVGEPVPETEEERAGRRSSDTLDMQRPARSLVFDTPTHDVLKVETSSEPTQAAPPSPTKITIISSPIELSVPLSPSAPSPARSLQNPSAYNPITTAGLWDSGISSGPGLRSRPTSMFVSNERRKKEERRREKGSKKDKKRGRQTRKAIERDGLMTGNNDKGEVIAKKKMDWVKMRSGLMKLFGKSKS